MKLNFGPVVRRPKCVHCGRNYDDHRAVDKSCPIGSKHRILGFTQYCVNQFYTPKAPRKKLQNPVSN